MSTATWLQRAKMQSCKKQHAMSARSRTALPSNKKRKKRSRSCYAAAAHISRWTRPHDAPLPPNSKRRAVPPRALHHFRSPNNTHGELRKTKPFTSWMQSIWTVWCFCAMRSSCHIQSTRTTSTQAVGVWVKLVSVQMPSAGKKNYRNKHKSIKYVDAW